MSAAQPSRRPRRVLHLIDTGGPGGAETIFLDLVLGLSRRGWECIPVVPDHDWLHRQFSETGLEVLEFQARRSLDLSYVLDLRRHVRSLGIDLVQTHLLGTSVYARLAVFGTGVPVVSTFHGQPDIPPGQRLGMLKTRLLASGRHPVVCVSESLKRHFVHQGLLPPSTRVIPNGIGFAPFDRPPSIDLRSDLGLAPDTPLVGAIGNVRASKAYDRLLVAFSQVIRERPEARLVVAGQCQGPMGDALMRLRDSLDLRDHVHFLGFRDDVAEILGNLDVFALSSVDEGFSLATVQAMASGLPVVATRSGGPEEIVGPGGPAVLVPPGDAEALAEALVDVLRHPQRARGLGEAARRHVKARYSEDVMVDRYEALYEETLGRRDTP